MNKETVFANTEKDHQADWRVSWRRFRIKLHNWEYWPVYIFNIPVLLIWLWHAIRSRNLFFFTLTNPGIETGGFFGESKSGILQHIPDEFKPKTILWDAPVKEEEVEDLFHYSGLSFPIIVKPEVGERGWLVKPVYSLEELKAHVKAHPIDLILQPFVQLPLEVSIMVYKMPDESVARVTSICQKEFLNVTGDGQSTIVDLIRVNDRAFLQYDNLKKKLDQRIFQIPKKGESILLEPIGNHCKGTKFINRNDKINESIRKQMVQLLSNMPGVYYGRFDMKINSWEELEEGKNIQVLEFNGASSDPAHIYDPEYRLWSAYRDIFHHWKIMAAIARYNRKKGHKPESIKKIISALMLYFRYKRTN